MQISEQTQQELEAEARRKREEYMKGITEIADEVITKLREKELLIRDANAVIDTVSKIIQIRLSMQPLNEILTKEEE